VAEIDSAKLRHWLTTPVRIWRSSLTLRVVASAVVGSSLVLILASVFLLYRVTDGIVTNARESAITDANQAMSEIEQQMRGVGYDYMNSDVVRSIASAAIQRGSSSGRYQVQLVSQGTDLRSPRLDVSVIPEVLRLTVDADPTMVSSVPTAVVYSDGTYGPGLVVASVVSGGGRDRFGVYFVFSFEQEAQTLTVVRTAVGLFAGVVIIGIALVAYIVSRQALVPLRAARLAAEKLSSGELTQLMPVRGTDDLAQLAVAMNHMANQLQQRIRQMEQLSRLQQRFVSDVSHELRTPLTTVRMAADVLYDRREGLGDVEQKSAVLLNRELGRFQSLLADLLEISRFDAGAAVLDLEDADLAGLVKGEMESLADLARDAGCEFRLTTRGDCTARLDPRRISRLVRNLMSNAVEHGEARPIDIAVAGDTDVVALTVRDHGVGFTLEQGRQLFNRFWRADPSRTRHIGGTGLGLSISQEDVRLHQGWIHAWGRPGQGAQFRVVLPRSPDTVVTHSPLALIPEDAIGEEVGP